MKKVGIMTFFRPINNGAVLQACAISKIILPRLGYEAELIDYRVEEIEIARSTFGMRRVLKEHGIRKRVRRVVADIVRFPVNYNQKRLFDSFINRFLPVGTKSYFSENELRKKCQNYDAYVVGSDLVWSPTMTGGLNPVYFLSFVKEEKLKIAYAPSIGTTNLSKRDETEIRLLLSKMDAISVREKSTAKQLEKLIEHNVKSVLDPTLLTDSGDWQDFYSQKRVVEDNYIFSFALESSQLLIDTVNKLAKEKNAVIVVYGRKNKLYKAKKVFFTDGKCGPAEFLNYIKNADTVVTNSFHGCAFSILFHKDFYCIPHSTRGIRMLDLLDELDLSERIVTDSSSFTMGKIEYERVEEKRNALRIDSLDYFRSALEIEKPVK